MRKHKHFWTWFFPAAVMLLSLPGSSALMAEEAETLVLPTVYDAREEGKTPTVRSQGSLGTCWALTAVSALEAAWMPKRRSVWSADHMSLNNDFLITQNDGGDYKMIMAYLAGWKGPVYESDDPYGDGETVSGLLPEAHVQEMVVLQGMTREQIKEMIVNYGPVQTSLKMNRTMTDRSELYYNRETFAFYDPEEENVDHDVLILGWDDKYSKENFVQTPSQNGAWICQNTWGEDFGDGGVFYVSYEDANAVHTGLCYTRVEETDNYDTVYQYDDLGWQARQGYDRSYCYFANVFTAESDEQLKAVGFYSTGLSSKYEIYLVTNFTGTDSFESMEKLTEGELWGMGYYTIDLPEAKQLQENMRFAVVVNIDTVDSKRPVAVELEKDSYTASVTLEGKEGYLSLYGGEWEHTEDTYQTNVCLKAYTIRE